jgi:hypothetical protein
MLERMKLEKRTGVILYEAALPIAEPPAHAPQRPTHWTPMLLDRQENVGSPYPYNSYNQWGVNPYEAGPDAFVIRTQTTDVRLIPDVPVQGGRSVMDGPLTVALRVVNHPNEKLGFIKFVDRKSLMPKYQNYNLDPVTGMPRNSNGSSIPQTNKKEDKLPQQYCIAGCPVLIYNVRLGRWEATRILEDGRHTAAPARDYLTPGASAVVLRVMPRLPSWSSSPGRIKLNPLNRKPRRRSRPKRFLANRPSRWATTSSITVRNFPPC